MSAAHQTIDLPPLLIRLCSALASHDLERVLSLLADDRFVPVSWESRIERGPDAGKRKVYKGHAEIEEHLRATLCHKEAVLTAPDDDEEVEQESLFSAFCTVKIRTPGTEEVFPKGFGATVTVEVKEGTSRIRIVAVEPDEAAVKRLLEEGKKAAEAAQAGDEMEL